MRLAYLPILLVLLLFSGTVSGQEKSNVHLKKIAISKDTIQLDSLSLVPGSVSFFVGDQAFTDSVFVDLAGGKVFFPNRPQADSISVVYRTFPIAFTAPYYHKDPKLIAEADRGIINPFVYKGNDKSRDIFRQDGLTKQGSIARGLAFGNNRDLSVNSELNLQLSGKVTDRINVLAAVTDDNIPIQAEGNTQQLQEFDQVYIQLFDQHNKLTAGDFQLRSHPSNYMKYFKKARGASFESRVRLMPDDTDKEYIQLQASAAVSRGKFARNVFMGVEGNQGPYRLRGAEGETFIIILSGTERVFIDGQQLTRGQEHDYVIDYNTSEITFTAKRLITKDKRIIVEFQYSDQNYARSLFQFSSNMEREKLNLQFQVYSEQDSKNQPLQQELDDQRKLILSNAGDSLNQALALNADSIGFSEGEVLYRLVSDTVVNGFAYDSVFVYSTNSELSVYRLGFSNVGVNNGNYELETTLANGKVYRWIAPENGIPQGSFEPILLLVTPKQRQMVTLGGAYKIGENTTILFEGALTNHDLNTFSTKDAGDNFGFAANINLENKTTVTKPREKKDPWILTSTVGYEQVDRYFTPIERFRSVEFERDWNIENRVLPESQHISTANFNLSNAQRGSFAYQFQSFNSGSTYNAIKNALNTNYRNKGWNLQMKGSLIQSESTENALFFRHEGTLKKELGWLTVGIRELQDYNEIRDAESDSLVPSSFDFWEWEAFINNGDSAKNRYQISYTQRQDHAPLNDQFRLATFGESVAFDFDVVKNPKNRLRGKIAYRELKITNDSITTQKPDNTLLSRLEYNTKLWKGAVTSASFYEIGSGLELRREFTYIEVPAGQGVYTWTDYNDNGQQELDEFEIAQFTDQATYIRVFTPSNDFVKAFTNQFSQSIFIQPRAVWRSKKGVRKFISRFSDQVAFRISRKTNFENGVEAFNPFLTAIDDTSLVSLKSSIRNSFYFNKTDPTFGAEINFQDRRGKDLLTNGFESRGNKFNGLRIRWNVTRKFLFNGEYITGIKELNSDFSEARNYRFRYFEAIPKITWQPGTKYRLAWKMSYAEKQNVARYGGENSILRSMGGEVKINWAGKGSLQADLDYISISFSGGETNASPVAYEMLNALRPGQNVTWNLSYQRTLGKNLQLSVLYNGRTSEGVPTVHNGGLQMRAFF